MASADMQKANPPSSEPLARPRRAPFRSQPLAREPVGSQPRKVFNDRTVKQSAAASRRRASVRQPAPGREAERLPPRSARGRPAASAGRRVVVARQADSQTGSHPPLTAHLSNFMPPGKSLSVTVTDNRYSMVTVRRYSDGYHVRAHRMFIEAEPKILRALARYIVHHDPRASAVLGAFIKSNEHTVKTQPRQRRRVHLNPIGKHHNLQSLFDELNEQRFGGQLDARITWGARRGRPRIGQKSIKMGSFSLEDRIIRIHPLLDDPAVPRFFVGWIVFHEMLHGKHEAQTIGGRRCYHTPAFVAEERSYEHYEKAHDWEQRNIERLLRERAIE